LRVRIKTKARTDLLAIRSWGEDRWGPERSRDFLEGLIDVIERLSEFPEMGRPRDVLAPGLRSVRYKDYLVFYVVEVRQPVVVAVLHERRNHAALNFADGIEDG
jgi:plasmid stabilization system protein ParE